MKQSPKKIFAIFLRNMKNVVINFVDTDYGPCDQIVRLTKKLNIKRYYRFDH